jgi:hypothetical protein
MKKVNRNARLDRATLGNGGELSGAPSRLSSRGAARILHVRERGGCSLCFPHGPETTNATVNKRTRSWKSKRKTQYKAP